MTYQTILNNEWGTVLYHPTDHYIYHTVHKKVSGAELHNILNTGLEQLKKAGAIKWLSDDRNNDLVEPADVVFSLQDWGPRAAAAGWKYWALVVPENVAGRASMQDVVEAYYNLGVRVAVFTDLDEARNWLVKL